MTWGCFAASGAGDHVNIDGAIHSKLYKITFTREKVTVVIHHPKSNNSWRLLQDNNPKHRK